MNTFPRQHDGANVLWIAPAIPGRTGYSYETGEPISICSYAVAQYARDVSCAYLFAVSSDHEVIGDDCWESVEEAKRIAIDSGNVKDGDWKSVN